MVGTDIALVVGRAKEFALPAVTISTIESGAAAVGYAGLKLTSVTSVGEQGFGYSSSVGDASIRVKIQFSPSAVLRSRFAMASRSSGRFGIPRCHRSGR